MAEDTTTNPITGYLLHDVVGNIEAYITEFAADKLQEAEDNGYVIVAERQDGTRERVKAADVSKPKPYVSGIALASPEYVDERIDAVLEALDAISALFAPLEKVLDKLNLSTLDLGDLTTALDKLRALKADTTEESEADSGSNA